MSKIKITGSNKKGTVKISTSDWCGLCSAVAVTPECDIKDMVKKINIIQDNKNAYKEQGLELQGRFIQLAEQRKELLEACKAVLEHVEDENIQRSALQCTLCYTYRAVLRKAIKKYAVKSHRWNDINKETK
jgi:hypothetical protein